MSGENMNFLATFLREKSEFSVGETLKAGSLAKGTSVKGNADLDVILFSPKYQDLQHFISCLRGDLNLLADEIKEWARREPGKVQYKGKTEHAVKLKMRAGESGSFVDVDLLPAYDILKKGFGQVKSALPGECSNQNPQPKAKKGTRGVRRGRRGRKNKPIPPPPKLKSGYESIGESEREYSSACLAPLQIKFTQQQHPNVKNLIRLVKHWKKTIDFQGKSKKERKIPTSYVLELLTIHAWEKAGKPDTFDTTKGFKAVLQILKDWGNINASWDVNYNKNDYSDAPVKMPHRPYILDPANPFNNVCDRFDGWPQVSTAAHATLHCKLFENVAIQRKKGDNHSYNWQ